jgi:adenosylcobinamide-phosphate synthase
MTGAGMLTGTAMTVPDALATTAAALAIEAACGYPAALFRVVRHPVVWIGALIGWLDARLNRPRLSDGTRRALGVGALAIIVAAAVLPAWFAARLGVLPSALLAASLLAQRSLFEHVRDVAAALESGGLVGGRAAVSKIVGRDPEALDEAGVARAAIESLAENFSDGVVAPALWCAVAGLPGIAGYKAINTADSMIGHRTPRHAAFGWAAARLDDVVNLPASRLAGLWLVLAALLHRGAGGAGAWAAMRRDAGRHRSPNAGWPEAAMAGALGLRLAGPRLYGGVRVEDAWMGDGRAEAGARDIRAALALYRTACALQLAAAVAAALIARG